MTIKNPDSVNNAERGTTIYTWSGLTAGDILKTVNNPRFSDKTAHVFGDFAADGSITFYGSNNAADVDQDPEAVDVTNGWVPLKDPQGNPMTYTAKDGEVVSQNFKYITGKVAGADTALSVSIVCVGR
jgi:hypothetical protein|nr:MAG TPA: hypothetical protein [Caudoviricetes sp.]